MNRHVYPGAELYLGVPHVVRLMLIRCLFCVILLGLTFAGAGAPFVQ